MRLPYSNMKMRHWNPGAAKPLILPVHVVCNTSDDDLYGNIKVNSRNKSVKWFKHVPAHDGVAVLCGSGPSLADFIEDIRRKQSEGAKVFAMNGATSFLHYRGITADYQVLIDARKETAQLIGPAKEYLFASQVHPECFFRKCNAILWHLQVEGIDDLLPEDSPPMLTLIGGSASVGNTATCLAYEMGYRNLQIYGYDSSHRDGKGHAFHQAMNDGDPCAVVAFDGKEYTVSLTMKLQAEKFQDTSRALKQLGCHIEVHGDGLLPAIFNAPQVVLDEAEKYERMWEIEDYREYAPGGDCVEEFLEKVKPEGTVIDFGCGTGRVAVRIAERGPVVLVDLVDNCRDECAKHLPFIKWDLRKPSNLSADYGFCADTMEHIPPKDVAATINNIMASARTVFFQICTVPDKMGAAIGQYLHLTVQPFEWWHKVFEGLGYEIEWSDKREVTALFIVNRKDN